MTRRARAAIIGIGCRLPGGVRGPAQLWQALAQGRDLITAIPEERWKEMVEHINPAQRPDAPWPSGTVEDVEDFDAAFFGITADEADDMDLQQRMLLEVAVEALADAGIAPSTLAGTRTGVYVGAASFDQAIRNFAPGRWATMQDASGAGMSILANRLSYTLDLTGPSLTIDTACSSSLVALHHARQAIEYGDVDTAIVAGTNILGSPTITAAFYDGRVLAADGRCKPYDVRADGYVRSEGVGVVVLKRADRARRDNDRMYAIVRASGVNSDGRSLGMLAPNGQRQQQLIHDLYTRAGIDPARVSYVEGHGTGTRAGDRTEASALAAALRPGDAHARPLLVGSAKSNLGHTEGAAGVVGVIKTALALHHRMIPPTINHRESPRSIARLPIRVPTEPVQWTGGQRRVAGVSAFGFGGTNAHAVLTPAPTARPVDQDRGGPVIIPVSARTPAALRGTAADWAQTLAGPAGTDLHQVASTAVHRRDHHAQRAAIVADTPDETAAALTALARNEAHPALVGPHAAPAKRPRTVFVFSGHGAHTAAMGERLHATEPVYRDALEGAREALAAHLDTKPWAPGDPLTGFAVIQHAIFCTQVATAALWRSWGVLPDAVVGHSLGEVAAAHVAGALPLDDAVRVLAVRSAILESAADQGGLLATHLSAAQAAEVIAEFPDLVIAVYAGPAATVVSGPDEPLKALHAHLEAAGEWSRWVDTGTPAHHPLLDAHLGAMRTGLAGLAPQDTDVRIHSTLTGTPVPGSGLDAEYWARQLREPVRLHGAVTALAESGPSVFVEVAPRATLGAALTEALGERGLPGAVVAPEGDDEHRAMRRTAAAVHVHGVPVSGPVPAGLPPAPLPPTRWDYTSAADALPDPEDLYQRFVAARDTEQRHTLIAGLVRDIAADVLLAAPEELDDDAPLTELGVNSVTMLQVRNRLHQAHPALRGLSARLLWGQPTINQITASAVQLLTDHGAGPTAHQDRAKAAAAPKTA